MNAAFAPEQTVWLVGPEVIDGGVQAAYVPVTVMVFPLAPVLNGLAGEVPVSR